MNEDKKMRRREIKTQSEMRLTPSQFKLLKYIWQFYDDFEFVPATSTTAKDFGMSRQAIWVHYDRFKKAGYLIKDRKGRGGRYYMTPKCRLLKQKYNQYDKQL